MSTAIHEPLISSLNDRLHARDDTEESVPGSDYHREAYSTLYALLMRHARRTARHWYVTAQVPVLVDVPDRIRNPWRVMPDVYVLLDAPGDPRYSLDTRDGTPFPQFVCEIASERTWRRDVGVKQRLYADLRVQEYVVFDPTGALLGEAIRAWRRAADGRWQRWQPDSGGYLESQVLGLRLRAEETLLRVYDPVMGRLPTGDELEERTQELEEITQEQANKLATAQERLKALEDEIARLHG